MSSCHNLLSFPTTSALSLGFYWLSWQLPCLPQLACASFSLRCSSSISSQTHVPISFQHCAERLSAWISLNDKPLEVYASEIRAGGKVVGYVESVKGQAFTVHAHSARAYDGYDWATVLFLDGVKCVLRIRTESRS